MSQILDSLNPQQRRAVEQTEGPCLILAGPGSGKTRILTHRIAYLIQEKGVDPLNILALTFTNKAATEMKERVRELMGKEGVTPSWMGTFHSICARILRQQGQAGGLNPDYVIYDESDTLEVIKKILKKLNLETKKFNPRAVKTFISGAKNELIDSKTYAEKSYGYFQKIVAEIYPLYQKELRENAALDFDDLLLETIRLFKVIPEVLDKYQNHFRYVLVDEYQDTNKAQYVLTKLMGAKSSNITVVGDMAQAIYSWRGADYRNILNFEKDYPQTKTFRLEQNYRSTQNILEAAKNVIQNNASHVPLDLWTDSGAGELIGLYEARDESDEARYIANQMQKEGEDWLKFAVLYRTNAQSRAVEEVFIRQGIPYRLVGGTKFYERKEIKDVLAYLRLIANPLDKVSRERIEKLGKRAAKVFEEKMTHQNWKGLSPLDLLDTVLEETKYLDRYDEKLEEEQARIENVKELRSVASEFDEITSFLENVALVQQDYFPNGQKKEENTAAVTLMTLHSAKGLEFEQIFLIGMEEGLLPHSRALTEPSELEEERRLCYVGLTRAKKKVTLSYARRRLYFGSQQANATSRFISEIPEDLLEHTPSARLGESKASGDKIADFLDKIESERWDHW